MINTKTNIISNCIKFLVAGLYFVGLKPYFAWGLTDVSLILLVTIPISLILVANASNPREITFASLFGFVALISALMEGRNLYGCAVYIMSATIFLNLEYQRDVYIYFKKIYVCYISVSAIVWILVLLGVSFPSETLEPLNQLKDYSYIRFPFLVIPDYDLGASLFDIIRFCGPFDEPGVIGSISLLMLAADNYNLYKPANIVLFITGIFSLSLFFYLGSFICILLSFLSERSISIKKILFIFFIALLIFASYNWEVTRTAIWERLEFDEYRGFSGNNRAEDDLKQYIDQIRWTYAYWFGGTDKEIILQFAGSASIQNAILQYGVFGCLIYAIYYIIYTYSKKSNYIESVYCIIILFMTLWQRPFLFDYSYIFLYLILIANYGTNTVSQKKYKIFI